MRKRNWDIIIGSPLDGHGLQVRTASMLKSRGFTKGTGCKLAQTSVG